MAEDKKKKSCECNQNVKKILLVEGHNDCHAIMHLCKAQGLAEDLFCIHNCGNDEGVLKELNLRLRAAHELRAEAIGVVLDADKPVNNPDLKSRVQAVTDKLRKVCSDYPSSPAILAEGIIIPNPPAFPKIGIWLMPNNQDVGMLEDFLISLAKAKQATESCDYPASLAYAETCVQNAQEQKFTSFKSKHHSKAIIHTYLAWHEPEPGSSLAQSISAHTLEPHTELADSFTAWLKNLFSE